MSLSNSLSLFSVYAKNLVVQKIVCGKLTSLTLSLLCLWEKSKFYDPVPRPPRYQTGLKPLVWPTDSNAESRQAPSLSLSLFFSLSVCLSSSLFSLSSLSLSLCLSLSLYLCVSLTLSFSSLSLGLSMYLSFSLSVCLSNSLSSLSLTISLSLAAYMSSSFVSQFVLRASPAKDRTRCYWKRKKELQALVSELQTMKKCRQRKFWLEAMSSEA